MTEEVAKVTVIVETRTSRRTFVYPVTYNLMFEEVAPDVHLHAGGVRHSTDWMNTKFSMTNAKDEHGHFRTMQLEELDPIPDEIRDLVTKATQHNINDENREKLIKALTKLVEKDRKENSK